MTNVSERSQIVINEDTDTQVAVVAARVIGAFYNELSKVVPNVNNLREELTQRFADTYCMELRFGTSFVPPSRSKDEQ
jgi:hypothetical protein